MNDMTISLSFNNTSKLRRYREAFSAFLTVSRTWIKSLTLTLNPSYNSSIEKTGDIEQYAKFR